MNVVFDLGGVVVSWNPDRIIETTVADSAMRPIVRTAVFNHPDWVELDRGTMDATTAIERAAARAGVPVSTIQRVMDEVASFHAPFPESLQLISDVRAAGHLAIALSNMHVSSIESLERSYSMLDHFDGAVVSCRVGLVKPERAIYEHLLSTYQLRAGETVFIDDTRVNLTAAEELGIRTILFQSPAQCRRELQQLGYLNASAGQTEEHR